MIIKVEGVRNMSNMELEMKIKNVNEKDLIERIEKLGGKYISKSNQFLYVYDLMYVNQRYYANLYEFNNETNDLRKNIGFFKFVEEHAQYDDEIYKLAVDKSKFVIDCMGGVQKIDETGQGLKEEILKLHDLWLKNVILTEGDWKKF